MKALLWLKFKKLKDEYKVIAVMMVLSIAFTGVFNMAGYSGAQADIGLVTQDVSQAFIDELVAQDHEAYQVYLYTLEEAKDTLEKGDIDVYYLLESQSQTQVKVSRVQTKEDMSILPGLQAFEGSWRDWLANKAMSLNLARALSGVTGLNTDQLQTITGQYFKEQEDRGVTLMPVSSILITSNTTWVGYDSALHGLIGFTVMFAMYTVTFGVADILMEKKQYTWHRALVSPLNQASLVFGHLSSIFVIGFLQIMTVFFVGEFVLGINWGLDNLVPVAGLVLAFCFAMTGFGLILTGLVKSMAQLGATAPILITGTAMLGGCMWPLQIVNSKLMLTLANFTPQKWVIEGIENLTMYQLPLSSIVTPMIMLCLMGVVLTGVGYGLVVVNKA